MRRRQVRWMVVGAALMAAAAQGCRSDDGREQAASVELMLYCGAGIRPAAEALIAAFQADNPNVTISGTYAGSGRLLGQMTAHPSGDLFMPGAEMYVDRAIEQGLAAGETKRIVAYFIPVIFVQKGNPKGIASLADLAKPGVRVGFGDERACAVGRKTLKILAKNNLPPEKIAPNVVYKSGTVNELGVAIQLRNVDAVILWDANARQFAAAGDAVEIPPAGNEISTIPLVLLKSSRHPEAARKFIEFVASARGRKLLKDNGYTVSLPKGSQASEAGKGSP